MPPSLRQLKNRIQSVENTRKIMRAMEMVSVTKLKRVEGPLRFAKAYSHKLEGMVNRLAAVPEDYQHPLLTPRKDAPGVIVCVLTSDTGLCGNYNNRITEFADRFIREQSNKQIQLIAIGKKGYNFFRKRNHTFLKTYLDLYGRFSQEAALRISADLKEIYINNPQSELYIAYTHFVSGSKLEPTLERFIEFNPDEKQIQTYLIEPNPQRIFDELMPQYILAKVRRILLDSFLSEHTARTVAMKMANDNAKELLEQLTLLRNKIRQASITTQVIEIISAAEALKG